MRIGIDLGGTKIEGILLGPDGEELARHRIPTPKGDYTGTVVAIASLVREMDAISERNGQPHPTVGVGIPGAISPATGRIKNANSTCLIGHALDRDIAAAIGRDVRLTNDANCLAVSEAVDGAAAGARVVFGVILGTGVGGGVVVDGKVLTGPNAIAGEWGHNPLPWPSDDERPGARCYCGLHGCIETFLSGPGLARDHEAVTGRRLDSATIVSLARDGDLVCDTSMQRYEQRLARALATVINLLDPDVIVLGGGLSNITRLYDTVPKLWGEWAFSDTVTTPLVQNLHGDSSGVRGAAWLWD